MVRIFMTILALLLCGYVAVCAYLYFNQEGLLFFPRHTTEAELDAIAREDGFAPWTNAAGARIGWRSTTGDPAHALLVFHGNGGFALGRNYEPLRRHNGHGPTLYLLEYPGYGARPGKPSSRAMTAAALEAFDVLAADPHRRIEIMGQSLGTGVACAVAAARPDRVTGVALVTPYDSLASGASTHYPWLPVRWLMRHQFNSDKNLAHYHGPVAFLIAGRDGTIPPRLAERLFAGYDGPKRQWLAPDAGHNDLDELLANWPEVSAWITASKIP
jgi:pimeloyl-ACP methyl ester carboxylesterase